MNSLVMDQIVRLRASLAGGVSPREALLECVGGTVLCNGLWRLYSAAHPKCGVDHWNEEWCLAWGLSKENVFAFGEDVFGNQLILTAQGTTVYLCDHENGSCHDLDLGVADLLEAGIVHGLSWIDFYSNGSLDIAKGFLTTVTWEQHLHWTQPLILGGAIAAQNVSVVDRVLHLSGHAKLWKQLSGLPAGTEFRIQ